MFSALLLGLVYILIISYVLLKVKDFLMMDYTIILLVTVVFIIGILISTIYFEKMKNLQSDQLNRQIIELLGSINDRNSDMHNSS
jgi:hypothetical protein